MSMRAFLNHMHIRTWLQSFHTSIHVCIHACQVLFRHKHCCHLRTRVIPRLRARHSHMAEAMASKAKSRLSLLSPSSQTSQTPSVQNTVTSSAETIPTSTVPHAQAPSAHRAHATRPQTLDVQHAHAASAQSMHAPTQPGAPAIKDRHVEVHSAHHAPASSGGATSPVKRGMSAEPAAQVPAHSVFVCITFHTFACVFTW